MSSAAAVGPLVTVVAIAVGGLTAGWLAPAPARAIERNFAASDQLDYFVVPPNESGNARDGFTNEAAFKLAVDVSPNLSAGVKLCHGCHGLELPFAYVDFRLADELNIRFGRFSPSFGAFNVRHDPANHTTTSKPLPYDMGRMLRGEVWNLGVLPSPFPDNGVEINGTHWFGDRVALDYAVYAVGGFKAAADRMDIQWFRSTSTRGDLIDNNSRPAAGGRTGMTLRSSGGSDLTVGASLMYGNYDPDAKFYYLIGGGDLSARVGRTYLRVEYLVRHQTFDAEPNVVFVQRVPASGVQTMDKHGYYVEVERMFGGAVSLLLRADGLYRAGNVPIESPLAPRSAIFRYTAGGAITLTPGLRLKLSAELWSFSNRPPDHENWAFSFHTGMVATF